MKYIRQESTEDEKSMGQRVAELVSPGNSLVSVTEGDEPDDFWTSLGGKGDYEKKRDIEKPTLESRLFHCSISPAGKLRVREVGTFSQEVHTYMFRFLILDGLKPNSFTRTFTHRDTKIPLSRIMTQNPICQV